MNRRHGVAVPWLAELLFRIVTPARERGFLLGDLAEEFTKRVARGEGVEEVKRWYWRQLRGSGLPGLRRLRNPRHKDRTPRRRRHLGDQVNLMVDDMRYAVRVLRRHLGFAAMAVIVMAIGVGSTTTVFSVVESTLLRPLPFPDPDRLVMPVPVRAETGRGRGQVSYGDYEDWSREEVFASSAVFMPTSADLSGLGEPTIGVPPVLGRPPAVEAFQYGGPPVVVLSDGLWRTHFGGAPEVVGQTVRLSGRSVEIVGVMPAEMDVFRSSFWVPLAWSEEVKRRNSRYDNYAFRAVARLAPGSSVEQAQARLAVIGERVAQEYPDKREGMSMSTMSLNEWLVQPEARLMLWVALGAVACVLLIGCLDIANLLVARLSSRHHELAIRRAIGAGQVRLLRQLFSESVLLSLAGGVLGVLLSVWGIRLAAALAPSDTPGLAGVGLNTTVLGFALLVTLGSALLFGLAPAFGASRQGRAIQLREDARGMTSGVAGKRVRSTLVVVQLALSVVLLSSAGLLLRTVQRLNEVDPGFDAQGLIKFELILPRNRYEPGEPVMQAYGEVRERIGAVPGVTATTVASILPMGAGGFRLGRAFLPEGRAEPPAGEELHGRWDVVAPGYFETMGIPVIVGRAFNDGDDDSAVPVMIVNTAFASDMFGGNAQALGQRVRSWRDENVYREVVGVVGDVRYFGAWDDSRPVVYVPHGQARWRSMVVVARTGVDPTTLTAAIGGAVREFDSDIAMANVGTMEDAFARSIADRRSGAYLLSGFAGIAVLLAATGLYGVLSYAVNQRRREFGVRVALGATSAAVLRLVFREATVLVVVGAGLGLVVALAASRVMASVLYGVGYRDPATFVTVTVALSVVALASSYLPAARATRADPLEAMRAE